MPEKLFKDICHRKNDDTCETSLSLSKDNNNDESSVRSEGDFSFLTTKKDTLDDNDTESILSEDLNDLSAKTVFDGIDGMPSLPVKGNNDNKLIYVDVKNGSDKNYEINDIENPCRSIAKAFDVSDQIAILSELTPVFRENSINKHIERAFLGSSDKNNTLEGFIIEGKLRYYFRDVSINYFIVDGIKAELVFENVKFVGKEKCTIDGTSMISFIECTFNNKEIAALGGKHIIKCEKCEYNDSLFVVEQDAKVKFDCDIQPNIESNSKYPSEDFTESKFAPTSRDSPSKEISNNTTSAYSDYSDFSKDRYSTQRHVKFDDNYYSNSCLTPNSSLNRDSCLNPGLGLNPDLGLDLFLGQNLVLNPNFRLKPAQPSPPVPVPSPPAPVPSPQVPVPSPVVNDSSILNPNKKEKQLKSETINLDCNFNKKYYLTPDIANLIVKSNNGHHICYGTAVVLPPSDGLENGHTVSITNMCTHPTKILLPDDNTSFYKNTSKQLTNLGKSTLTLTYMADENAWAITK